MLALVAKTTIVYNGILYIYYLSYIFLYFSEEVPDGEMPRMHHCTRTKCWFECKRMLHSYVFKVLHAYNKKIRIKEKTLFNKPCFCTALEIAVTSLLHYATTL